MPNSSHYKAVLLDVDGTLVDSNDFHAESWQRALVENGLQISYGAVRKLIGMGGDKLLPTLTGISETSDEGKRIAQRQKEIYQSEFVPRLRLFPGTNELLQRIRDAGLRLAIATSSRKEDLEKLVEVTGLDIKRPPLASLLHGQTLYWITKDDAESSKPDPDLIEAALKKLGLAPEAVVMIGDTPYDIHAAKEARVKTIAFRSGGWDVPGLQGALEVYDGPWDLLARWDQSALQAKPQAA